MSKLVIFAPKFVVQLLTEDDRPVFAVAHVSQANFVVCCASTKQVLKAFSPHDLERHEVSPGSNNRTAIITLEVKSQGSAYPLHVETIRLSAPHGTAGKIVALLEQAKAIPEGQSLPLSIRSTQVEHASATRVIGLQVIPNPH